jgi:hypothetical protein
MAARQQHADLDFNNVARIINLPDGTDPQHPATVAQVNALVEGLAWKDSARVRAQANVNLASPGSTMDGVTLDNGDRFLADQQTDASENGIYIFNGASTPATRAPDASTADELEGAVLTIEEGTDAGTSWRQTEVNITLDTDDVLFVAFGVSVPDASTTVKGKIEIATQGEVDAGTDTIRAVTPDTLANYAGGKKQAAGTVGDGSSTSFTITHNFNKRAVHVAVYRNSGNYDEIDCEVRRNNVNSIDLLFASAPTSGQFAYVVTA